MVNHVSARVPKGLTLVEVVIAVACLSIAIAGTLNVWVNGERMESIAREEAIAQAAITKIISDMRATPFDQIPTRFSGGDTDGDPLTNRLLPGSFPVRVGGDLETKGVMVTRGSGGGTTNTRPSVRLGDRTWTAAFTNEMRVVFINDQDPIESELGEVGGNGDGIDLNRDGVISSVPFSTVTPAVAFDVFPDSGAERLFPRALERGAGVPTQHYLNISEMLVLPVIVQVRWWSLAGVPREITVVTFFTNRAG